VNRTVQINDRLDSCQSKQERVTGAGCPRSTCQKLELVRLEKKGSVDSKQCIKMHFIYGNFC
jgi:hypothetical protein